MLDGRWVSDKLYKRECHLECSSALPACKIFITFFLPSLSALVFEMDLEHFFLLDRAWLSPCKLQTTASSSAVDRQSCLKVFPFFVAQSYLVIHPFTTCGEKLERFFFFFSAVAEWLTLDYLNVISWLCCCGLVRIRWWFCSWREYLHGWSHLHIRFATPYACLKYWIFHFWLKHWWKRPFTTILS